MNRKPREALMRFVFFLAGGDFSTYAHAADTPEEGLIEAHRNQRIPEDVSLDEFREIGGRLRGASLVGNNPAAYRKAKKKGEY
jgi:hypothetical protein